MRFIAHRGNVDGPSNLENSPSQIDWCLNNAIDCEVDLWIENGTYKLGHNQGKYLITKDWLLDRKSALWVHCKNTEALHALRNIDVAGLNYFWHQNDMYTLTSQDFIWVYPGERVPPGSIAVLPENWLTERRLNEIHQGFGICTDYISRFKEKFGVTKN